MTWFKVDDGFWSNPKVLNLSEAATSLWVRAGSYCCQHLTDGFVPGSVMRLLGSNDAADDLVDAGLWRRVDADDPGHRGYQFHDWGEYQETSDAVKNRREQAKERMRKVRASRRSSPERSSEHTANVREKFARSDANPDPTRPDPTSSTYVEEQDQDQTSGSIPRPTRFDEFWALVPRKVGKQKARTKYTTAVKRAGSEQTVIDGMRRFANDPNLPETQFIPHPTTWLERNGWEDEPLPPRLSVTDIPPARRASGTRPEDWRRPSTTQPPPFVDAEVLPFKELGQ